MRSAGKRSGVVSASRAVGPLAGGTGFANMQVEQWARRSSGTRTLTARKRSATPKRPCETARKSSTSEQSPEGKRLRAPAEQCGALDGERVLRIDRAVGRTRRARHIGAGAHPREIVPPVVPAVRDVVGNLDVHDVQQAVAVDVAAAQGEVPGIRRAAIEAGVRRIHNRNACKRRQGISNGRKTGAKTQRHASTSSCRFRFNCNGLLNIVDVQVAYDIANGGHAERRDLAWMRSRADVTGPAGAPDGAVDAQDAFAIQRAALLGWGEAMSC